MTRACLVGRQLCVWMLLWFSVSACVSAPNIRVSEQLQESDLALGYSKGRNRDDGSFTEQLIVRGVLQGGGSFYSKLTISNLANTDGRASAMVEVTLPDGRKALHRERKDRGEWQTSSERLEAQVGDIHFHVSLDGARIEVENEAFKATVTVQSSLPALRPEGGILDAGGQWYVTTIPVPRGNATVTIEAPFKQALGEDGEDALAERVQALGIGYAEHRAGNVPPYELARAWFNILHISEDETLVMSAFEKVGGEVTTGKGSGWVFAANGQGLHLYEPLIDVWTRNPGLDEATGYLVPSVVFVADRARESFRGVIKANALTERKDDLDGLKKLERAVVRRFMQPWTFSFTGAEYLLRKQNEGQSSHEITGQSRFLYQQLSR